MMKCVYCGKKDNLKLKYVNEILGEMYACKDKSKCIRPLERKVLRL